VPGGDHLINFSLVSTEYQDLLKISGGALGLLMYVPLVISAVRDRGAGQSFATWGLWALLDTTVTVSLIVQRGNFWLTAGFATGSIILALVLLGQGRFEWGRLETVILLLVLVCLGLWKFSGPKVATVAAAVAITIAGLPALVELWRNPQPAIAHVWAGYTVASLLSFLGGTEWSIEERFAPGVFTVQSLALMVMGYRRKPVGPPHVSPGA
jgi:hypothetical protein